MENNFFEPYKIKMVENIYKSTTEERKYWIKKAKYNLFNLESKQVMIDLLTDSGTGAMSDNQWAEVMKADESYAGSQSFHNLKNSIKEILDFDYIIPTHQGRAAENILFQTLIKEGDVIPGNSHFDTTKGHIEYRKAKAIDCSVDEAFDIENTFQFKGNIDIEKLETVYKEYGSEKIPFTLITITCNTSGGQPVSIENIENVYNLNQKYNIPLFIDGARYAENAYFIKTREEKYKDWSIKEIIKKVFSYSQAMTMSSKKDGLVNMGGFIAMKSQDLYRKCSVFCIIYEGFLTYGGMSGKDMAALSQGLHESAEFNYLESRIYQSELLGNKLIENNIPIQKPIGGHAIFIDAKRFFPKIPIEQFPAQSLALELYINYGIRGVEIGTILADRDPITRENRYPKNEFVRLAIPRRTYTSNHITYIANSIIELYKNRDNYNSGYNIAYEAPIMRHFTVELEKI